MKKFGVMLLAGAIIVSSVAGCSKSSTKETLSNDYITISGYNGIEVLKVEAEEVTDEQINNQIVTNMGTADLGEEMKDLTVKEGDTIVIDYVGKKDGVAFDGGSYTGYRMVAGESGFIEGFDEGLIGHKYGEQYDLPLKFPDTYTSADLAGKDVVFTITIQKIYPELTDAIVKKLSKDSKTVEEYKKEIKKELKKTNEESAKTELSADVWTAVVNKAEMSSYPDDEMAKQQENLTKQYKQLAENYGVSFEDFLTNYMNGMTEDTFNTQVKEVAKNIVKQQMIVNLIAEEAGLSVSDKDYDKKIGDYVTNYGYDSQEAMEEQIGKDVIKEDMLTTLVKDWLTERCKQVDELKEDKADTSDSSDKKDTSDKEESTDKTK